jgi:hypothetical protein
MTKDCIDHNRAGKGPGYAQMTVGGAVVYAHRYAYAKNKNITIADIAGKVVMHTCDNPRCINPAHLTLGSQADNMADMVAKGRSLVGTKHTQAKLTELEVACMRSLWKSGTHTTKQLASEFGCGTSQVNRIVNGGSWSR